MKFTDSLSCCDNGATYSLIEQRADVDAIIGGALSSLRRRTSPASYARVSSTKRGYAKLGDCRTKLKTNRSAGVAPPMHTELANTITLATARSGAVSTSSSWNGNRITTKACSTVSKGCSSQAAGCHDDARVLLYRLSSSFRGRCGGSIAIIPSGEDRAGRRISGARVFLAVLQLLQAVFALLCEPVQDPSPGQAISFHAGGEQGGRVDLCVRLCGGPALLSAPRQQLCRGVVARCAGHGPVNPQLDRH